jgi:hypothetical protein
VSLRPATGIQHPDADIELFYRDIVNIILARGRLQQVKHIGTGGSAMNPSRGGPTQRKFYCALPIDLPVSYLDFFISVAGTGAGGARR